MAIYLFLRNSNSTAVTYMTGKKTNFFFPACSEKLRWNSPGLSVDTAVTQRTIFWPSHQSSFSLCCIASPDWHFWRAGGASTTVRQTLSDNSALVGTSDWPEAMGGSEGNATEMLTSRLRSISNLFFLSFSVGGVGSWRLFATRFHACDHLSLSPSIYVCVLSVCVCVGVSETEGGGETHRHSPTVPMSYTSRSSSQIFLTFLK